MLWLVGLLLLGQGVVISTLCRLIQIPGVRLHHYDRNIIGSRITGRKGADVIQKTLN